MNVLLWLNDNFNLLKKPRSLGGMPSPTAWKYSKILIEKSEIDDLKFIFSQAKDRVKETSDEGDRWYNRSIAIITICITGITGLLTLLLQHFDSAPYYFATIPLSILLVRIIVILKDNVRPVGYMGIGSYPVNLFNDAFYKDVGEKKPEWH